MEDSFMHAHDYLGGVDCLMGSLNSNELHFESVVIDGLNVSVWDLDVFEGLKRGGVTAINATTAVYEGFRGTVRNIEQWNLKFDTYKKLIMPIRRVEDIGEAKERGRVGIIIGFQNTSPLEDDVNLLQVFRDLGVRIMQLTYNDRNYSGDGCFERTDSGLSEFGLRVVGEMNRQGILIDLSHTGYRTAMDAIEVSDDPVAFTHANPKALSENPRNKTDEQIKALAEKGGVIGATPYPIFLPAGYKSKLSDFLDVMDYLVDLVGVNHVAVGTDFTEKQPEEFFIWLHTGKSWERPFSELEYPVIYPEGIRSADEFPNITRGLVERGYTESEVKKIIGENWLRLYSQVWNSIG